MKSNYKIRAKNENRQTSSEWMHGKWQKKTDYNNYGDNPQLIVCNKRNAFQWIQIRMAFVV